MRAPAAAVDDRHRGVLLARAAGDVPATSRRAQVDVGHQPRKAGAIPVQQGERVVGARGFDRRVAGFLERVAKQIGDQWLVVHDQDDGPFVVLGHDYPRSENVEGIVGLPTVRPLFQFCVCLRRPDMECGQSAPQSLAVFSSS